MPESIVFRCLAAIREFLNDDEVPEVAGQGIRLLPGPLLAEAVDAIVDLPETYGPTLLLGAIAPDLPPQHREIAMKKILSDAQQVPARRAVLAQATKAWPARLQLAELATIRRCFDRLDLDDCFDLLATALPLLERIAGEAVHEQCLDGVRTVQRWWPQVAG